MQKWSCEYHCYHLKNDGKKRSTIPPCSIFFGVCFMSSTFLLNYNGDSNLCTLTHTLMSEPAELAAEDCNDWPFASIFFNVVKVQAWIFYNLNIWYKTSSYPVVLNLAYVKGGLRNARESVLQKQQNSFCSFFKLFPLLYTHCWTTRLCIFVVHDLPFPNDNGSLNPVLDFENLVFRRQV